MLIDAPFQNCILCGDRPAGSREHLIPECVGGTLEAPILCTSCNSEFGSDFVSQLKKDPSIRIAVHGLRDRIPEFASHFEEGLKFHAEGAGGIAVEVSRRGDTWKTRTRETNADGLVMDTHDVAKYVRKTMEKRGFSEAEAESCVTGFAACENGEQFQLPSGDILIKNVATVQLPKLTEGFVDNRLPVLIAFEFLALSIGNLVLGPEFDAVRKYIRFGTETEQVRVLNKRARKPGPVHTVRFKVEKGTLKVVVAFFQCYVFDITFRSIPMPPREFVYFEDLENKQNSLELSRDDAN